MFDIGFWEIVVCAIVALVVVGPEKFPGLVRNVGYWLGRAREVAGNLKAEMDAEIEKVEKIKELANKQLEIRELHEKIATGEEETPTRAKPVGPRHLVQEHTQIKLGGTTAESSTPKVENAPVKTPESANQTKP